jgi:hypothetical protein
MGLYDHPDEQKAAEYRRKSIDAGVRAVLAKDDFMQRSWMNIARSYQEMAERLERKSKL